MPPELRGALAAASHIWPFVVLLSACRSVAPVSQPPNPLDRESPQLLNAFFGLDDALPGRAIALCPTGPGADGMPVTFSRRVTSMEPTHFSVITQSGARKTPTCVTLRPADETSERHTVLLIGDLGSAQDPPRRVEVTGDVALEGGGSGKGLAVDVTALESGPFLVLAIAYAVGTVESDCPGLTRQVVQVTWAGGVQPKVGATQESHRTMYRVVTSDGQVTPIALGDVDDQDNYVHLCLDTDSSADLVRARGGVLVDPRGDLNPATTVRVHR